MLLGESVPYLRLHCNLVQMGQAALECLYSKGNLMPEELSYWDAVLSYVKKCRSMPNQGEYQLLKPPKLSSFNQSLRPAQIKCI